MQNSTVPLRNRKPSSTVPNQIALKLPNGDTVTGQFFETDEHPPAAALPLIEFEGRKKDLASLSRLAAKVATKMKRQQLGRVFLTLKRANELDNAVESIRSVLGECESIVSESAAQAVPEHALDGLVQSCNSLSAFLLQE